MNTFLKTKFLFAAVLLQFFFAFKLSAQWVWFSNDTTGTESVWTGPYLNGPTAFVNVSNNHDDKVEGTGSLQIDYRVEAYDGWGGYAVRAVDNQNKPERLDLSSGKYLSFWYKVVTAAQKSAAGDLNFEFKIQDKTGESGRDLWIHGLGTIMETKGEWKQVKIPIMFAGINNWTLQFGDDNKQFEPWAVCGVEIAFVFIPAAGGGTTNTPFATGTVLLDKFQILESAFAPVFTFDNQSDTTNNLERKNAFWKVDSKSDGSNSDKQFINLTTEGNDFVEGNSSMKVDYSLVANADSESVVEFEHYFFGYPLDISSHTSLVFYVKNLIPSLLSQNMFMRVFLYDDAGECKLEGWVTVPNFHFDKQSDWQFVHLSLYKNLENKKWDELRPGDVGISSSLFGIDFFLEREKIRKIKFQLVITKLTPGEITKGSFLIDALLPSGYLTSDIMPPVSVEISITPLKYSNKIEWTAYEYNSDGPYDLFFSLNQNNKFTKIAKKLEGKTVSLQHYIFSPLTDRLIDFYYGLDWSDGLYDVDYIYPTSAISNTARGIPVISNIPPNNFTADGNLSEWENIKPWVIKSSDSTGFVPDSMTHSGNSDLWYKSWVSLSKDSLYAAFEVHDNTIITDINSNDKDSDSPELMIGLYDYKGRNHTTNNLCIGKTPDYHFRFNSNKVTEERKFWNEISKSGDSNYSWIKTFDSTYVVEWGIPLSEILDTVEHDYPKFVQKTGMKLALNFSVNDADVEGTRKSLLSWAPEENEPGLQNIDSWNFSWLGNPNMSIKEFESFENYTDVTEPNIQPFEFSLEQNYPNPFNPETKISFNLKSATHVSIKVYNVLGAEITTLVDDYQTPGKHTLSFNAVNLASGVYFFRMNAGGVSTSRKMMLVK